jgi:sialic acid synthase
MIIGKKKIKNHKTYIIAEIGHNHQGDIKLAMKMIDAAANSGVDAVKLQKRDNFSLYTKKFFNSIYNSENSYAKTYGLHREKLEFNLTQFKELKHYTNLKGLDFFATPFDFKSVEFLEKVEVPLYKIASADLNNHPLQKLIKQTGKPIILSTGASTLNEVKKAVKNLGFVKKGLALLQCTASYPAKIQDLNLKVIETYKKNFPELTLGLSDHENGIDAGPIAYMYGARVFEKHFTIDRSLKGTDQSFSLEPLGMEKFVRNIKRINDMLGDGIKKVQSCERKPIFKMSKSIVAKDNIQKNTKITFNHLSFKSPGGGLKPYEYKRLIGKKTKQKIFKDQLITLKSLTNKI